jgi:RimJ/RimL family protein N-acetyltransferase
MRVSRGEARTLSFTARSVEARRSYERYRQMHRVFAEADDRNVPVRRLLERLGFRCEARLVEADWFKGEWSTLRLYAMLNREWHERP